jgi:hypothetical protein
MLSGKSPLTLMHSKVQKGIQPGVKISGSSQTVARAAIGRSVFTNMVDERNGRARFSLEGSYITEQGGHLAGHIFIDGIMIGCQARLAPIRFFILGFREKELVQT